MHAVTGCDYQRFAVAERSKRESDEILLRKRRFQRRTRHAGRIFRIVILRVGAVVNSYDFRRSVIDDERLIVSAVRHRTRKFFRINHEIHFGVIGNGNVLFDNDIFDACFRGADRYIRNVIRHDDFTGKTRDVSVGVGNVHIHGVFAGLIAVVSADIFDIDLQIRDVVGNIERTVIVGNGNAAYRKRAHIGFRGTERYRKRGAIFYDGRFIGVRR